MRKADISTDVEYYTASGRTYVYGEKRVRVDGIGAHKNDLRSYTWNAQHKLGYREKVEAYRNDPDLSPNQVKEHIAALDAEVDALARKSYRKYTVDGKGSGILVTFLDTKTGEPNEEMGYKDGQYVKLGRPARGIIETRDIRSTWADHVASVEASRKAQAEAKEKQAKRTAQKMAEVNALVAALPEGISSGMDAYPSDDTISFDRRSWHSSTEQVVMSRATLAKLLGVSLPEPELAD